MTDYYWGPEATSPPRRPSQTEESLWEMPDSRLFWITDCQRVGAVAVTFGPVQ